MTPKEYLEELRRLDLNRANSENLRTQRELTDLRDLLEAMAVQFDEQEMGDDYAMDLFYDSEWLPVICSADLENVVMSGVAPLLYILDDELENQTRLNQLK